MVYALPPAFPQPERNGSEAAQHPSESSASQHVTTVEATDIFPRIADGFNRAIANVRAFFASVRQCLLQCIGRGERNWERVVEEQGEVQLDPASDPESLPPAQAAPKKPPRPPKPSRQPQPLPANISVLSPTPPIPPRPLLPPQPPLPPTVPAHSTFVRPPQLLVTNVPPPSIIQTMPPRPSLPTTVPGPSTYVSPPQPLVIPQPHLPANVPPPSTFVRPPLSTFARPPQPSLPTTISGPSTYVSPPQPLVADVYAPLSLPRLQTEIAGFAETCATSLQAGEALDLVQLIYAQIDEEFVRLSQLLQMFQESIDDTSAEFMFSTTLHDQLEDAKREFTDRVVTNYPHAFINYGRSCVSLALKETASDRAIAQYQENYPLCREIRGDGNCFFYAFTVGLLEHLVRTNGARAFATSLENYNDAFILANKRRVSPGKEVVITLLKNLAQNPSKLDSVLGDSRNMLCCVHYFRHLAAKYMHEHPADFRGFLMTDVTTHIEENLLPMGKNADQQEIIAMCKALQFPVRIHDIANDGDLRGTVMGDERAIPLATLCRNEEHYVLFY